MDQANVSKSSDRMSVLRENIDTIVQTARAKRVSGEKNLRTSLPHISPTEHNRIAVFVDALHLELARNGVVFQFLELFLSPVLYQPIGKHRSRFIPQLFHSSAIAIDKKETGLPMPLHPAFKAIETNVSDRLWESHASEMSIAKMERYVAQLDAANIRYLDKGRTTESCDADYEFFRYFCLCTLFTYLVARREHAFSKLGIAQFFEKIIDEGRFDYFNDIAKVAFQRGTQPKQGFINDLQKCFADYQRKFPEASGAKPRDGWSAEKLLLHRMASDSDTLVRIILHERELMPLECYRIFFGSSTNDYPTWVRSVSTEDLDQGKIHSVDPDVRLASELGKLNKTVNYRSYSSYLDVFDQHLIARDGDRLGVMVIAPFTIDIGLRNRDVGKLMKPHPLLCKQGFFRAMRRISNGDNPQLIKGVEYDLELSAHDEEIFMALIEDIQSDFTNLGRVSG